MNKVVVNDVFKAPKPGAPTFYLLPGIDGGDDLDPGGTVPPGGKSWFGMTDIQGFFANKNVNVVSPLGGSFSWYTDWVNDGSRQYQMYMTKELPLLINAQYKTNGRNAIGGLSSTGGTAIDYAIQAPGVYRAVGSYSGFPSVSDPDEAQDVSLTLSGGGASAEAMWSPWVARCGWPTIRRRTSRSSSVSPYTPQRTLAVRATSIGCPQASGRTSAADSSRAKSPTARSASRMLRRPPGYPSTTSFDPKAPTPGACSNRRCKSPGTPQSDRHWGLSRPASWRYLR
jgi:hypothetical protein